jgi:uncharacterized damage-inducible protein DinB
MNVTDVLELYAYDRWANAQVLAIASGLTDEQRSRRFAASYGSVAGTLVHILWSEWVWLGRWPTSHATTDPRSVSGFEPLRHLWLALEAEQRAFLAGLADADLLQRISYLGSTGGTWTYTLQHMLQHVVNHSTYHRGQLTTMFRELGATPRPLDFLDYFDELAGAGA